MSLYEDLFNQLLIWKKIDTHEHFLPQNTYQDHPDILFAILRESYLPWIVYGARDHNTITVTREGLLQGMKKIPASAFLRYIIEAFQYMYGFSDCLLYTSDAADDLLCVDLGGRRIIKKKKK